MNPHRWLPDEVLDEVVQIRLNEPKRPKQLAQQRKRPNGWRPDGRLVILAADHPGRGATAAGGNPWALANRMDLLRRIAKVLMQPGVDGLLATPDIMDEILMVNDWIRIRGGPDFLDDKFLIGSMNRSGLAGAVFELDDVVSAYTADAISAQCLDAAKILLKLDLQSMQSARTLQACAQALEQLDARDIPVFLEPIAADGSIDTLVQLVGVATALGPSTSGRFLKLPMVEDFERVAGATTCPILLLGGNSFSTTDAVMEEIKRCMNAGRNVRGLMIGRSVLYPADASDPADVAARLVATVHGGEREEVRQWGNL